MSWSPQQDAALKAVHAWIKDRKGPQVFRLFGYAGTGKTTIARELAEASKGSVLFGAFTGKAALMMRKKGCRGASTIHSMIYRTEEDEKAWEPKFVLNPEGPAADAELIVIDECSMVDDALARDLLSFEKRVLVLGDPAQLPPVKGAGYFTEIEPDHMLTEVHRQARDNPIIRMSMLIREGGTLERGEYGESRVVDRSGIDAGKILAADQVLVGLNRTRVAYNGRIRALLKHNPDGPQKGDRLVCLRNNREKKLFNGGLFTVEKVSSRKEPYFAMEATSEDHAESRATKIKVRQEFFKGEEQALSWEEKKGSQEFTYGYALTCHKAQGSQWNDVIVFNESSSFREHAGRWLYTAVTRAAERVTMVTP